MLISMKDAVDVSTRCKCGHTITSHRSPSRRKLDMPCQFCDCAWCECEAATVAREYYCLYPDRRIKTHKLR